MESNYKTVVTRYWNCRAMATGSKLPDGDQLASFFYFSSLSAHYSEDVFHIETKVKQNKTKKWLALNSDVVV